jgi:ABC-type phosphate transport system substrate-binding protein
MRFFSARRVLPACTVATAVAVASLAAGGSSAWAATQCSGANITGQGASVMKNAYQNVFGPDFNTSANGAACSETQGEGGKPTVKYESTSSGAGLESWGVGGKTGSFEVKNAFVVTEEPPNPSERTQIEENETTKGSAPESLLTIPVAQESIAILVHLPSGCTATSTSFPGRLVIGNATLQKIFLGTISNWSEIKDGGDALTGTCSSPITRVVRQGPEPAGSTHIFKKYLNLINDTSFPTENHTNKTWNELSEGPENIVWPEAAAVVRPAKTGDSAEVSAVAEKASSIGYASLADARGNKAFIPPEGGKEKSIFWAPIQNSGVKTTKETFADPSTDGDTSETADANCAKEKYTNGKGAKFPPTSTDDTWQEVTTDTKEKNYPLCGIAYQLALTKYSAYPLTTSEEETTVSNFLDFALETKTGGGQKLLENHDYEPLPTKVDKESLSGVKLIGL